MRTKKGLGATITLGALSTALAIMTLSAMPGASAATRRPPANDDVASATVLSRGTGSIAGSNVGGSFEAGEPTFVGYNNLATSWYRWVAPGDGVVVFDTCRRWTFDTMILVGQFDSDTIAFTSGFTEIDDNDDWDDDAPPPDPQRCRDVASTLHVSVTAGETYYIGVAGYDGDEGSFVLSWSFSRD